jgi:hypothetical protein
MDASRASFLPVAAHSRRHPSRATSMAGSLPRRFKPDSEPSETSVSMELQGMYKARALLHRARGGRPRTGLGRALPVRASREAKDA